MPVTPEDWRQPDEERGLLAISVPGVEDSAVTVRAEGDESVSKHDEAAVACYFLMRCRIIRTPGSQRLSVEVDPSRAR